MFPYDGYLKLARKMADVDDESCMRSAVSRAYYASLHKSIKFAEDSGKTFSCKGKPELHREVIDYFNYGDNIIYQLMSAKLYRLRISRNKCDYDDNIGNIKKITENAIKEAEEIFNNIS